MKINFKSSIVFQKNWDAIQNGYKIIINEGSSRSSKTQSIMEVLICLAAGKKITVTIVREKMTWIKSTILKDFAEVVSRYNIPVTPEINPNRPEQVYNVLGSEFAFFGLDYPEKFKGRKQDIFWINEAIESDIKAFNQLEMRTTWFGMLDYNPSTDEHWIYDNVEPRDDAILIHSTMLDNPFLEDTIIKKIKSYDPDNPDNVRQGTADKYMWEVYGLGIRTKLEGLIFNVNIVDDIPNNAKFIAHGLDFGYSNDPAAFGSIYLYNNELYLEELFYKTGLKNIYIKENDKLNSIVGQFELLNISKDAEIFADSSEPKSIDEIFHSGYNIQGADKGADSIRFGIDLINQYKINITKNSFNALKESRKYKWAEDRNGKSLNKPVDAYNHFWDAIRYAARMKLSSAIGNNNFFIANV